MAFAYNLSTDPNKTTIRLGETGNYSQQKINWRLLLMSLLLYACRNIKYLKKAGCAAFLFPKFTELDCFCRRCSSKNCSVM